MKHYARDTDQSYQNGDYGQNLGIYDKPEYGCSTEVEILLNACDRKIKPIKAHAPVSDKNDMSALPIERPPSAPIYDGYATIRARGLYRSRSIRASMEIEESRDGAFQRRPPVERKRTLSLMSNLSQEGSSITASGTASNVQSLISATPSTQSSQSNVTSNNNNNKTCKSDEFSNDRSRGKHVKPQKIADYEPLYATVSQTAPIGPFRPISNGSSSSGDGTNADYRSKASRSMASKMMGLDPQHLKKNSGFSLDSLQSSATPRTPDYTTGEEENIFLYTAPESPMRPNNCAVRNSFEGFSPGQRTYFEIEDSIDKRPPKERHTPIRSISNVSTHYQRAQSFGASARPERLNLRYYQRCESESPPIMSHLPNSPTSPPPAPIRRESLYSSRYSNSSLSHDKPHLNDDRGLSIHRSSSASLSPSKETNTKRFQPSVYTVNPSAYRSCSAGLFERSSTNQSLLTIDQDELLVVPKAMPELQNPIDRRYHTLGHLRIRSLGTSVYHPRGTLHLGSMLNLMPGSYYSTEPGHEPFHAHFDSLPKSTENLKTMLSSGCVVSEYSDPLDFKIGCQTTLRSKPIIPWYELATRDFKRKSCPLVTGSGQTISSDTMNTPVTGGIAKQAHVVAAFEQSLSNMTSRLQHLTATAERKDDELTDMRQTIELLRKQSIQAGLTTAHMQSMGVQTPAQAELLNNNKLQQLSMSNAQSQAMRTKYQLHNGTSTASASASASPGSSSIQRHHSTDSVCSVNSASSACSGQDKKQKKKGWLRSSFTKAFSRNAKISKTSRHSGPSNHQSIHQQQSQQHHSHVRGSKHSLEKGVTNSNGHDSYTETSNLATQSPLPRQNSTSTALNGSPSKRSPAKTVTLIENAKPIDAIEHDGLYMVEELKKQLREKDLVLTDIRLEALSSASQLESLKETVNKMRAEMMSLKQNNERLQKLVTSHSLAGSETSLGNAMSPNGSIGDSRRYSLADGNCRPQMELPGRLQEDVEEENVPPAPAPEPPPMSPSHTHIDLAPPPPALESIPSPTHLANATEELPDITDGKKIAIACYLGQPESFPKYFEEMLEADDLYAKNASGNNGGIPTAEDSERPKSFCTPSPNEFVIAYTYISGKTTWQNLDYIVRKTFKDYLSTIDPGTNLGLNTDSITSYHLGEAKRGPEMGFPELLPCGYIIGNVRTLYICLQGVGSLAFDSLIPRSIVHRYISLMSEHRRLILCGPSGTGKSYLARRLAEFLVARSGRGNLSEAIATFNVDHKSSKELRQYLGHVAEQASIANGASELPSVIILDNLHHASALGDVFSSLLSSGPAAKLPCIIGTMSQATCNTTNLQLHHNFRWVLTANHMEPVKGFLGRFLRRRLFQLELQLQQPQSELAAVLAWLPLVWQHINRFLETHSSSDVTIGPRLFLSCPLDLKDSQVWFTDIWNYHLSPYLVEAVREGVQLYGRRGGVWNDPSAFIRNSYPWPFGLDSVPPLRQINAEDVGLEGMTANSNENTDPLLNMLMRLQEAANYPENQDEESECASLDSNITPDSSAGAE